MKSGHSALYKIEIKNCLSKARAGKLEIGNKSIPTPILWLGHRVGGNPKPWQAFRVPGLLMNAWDILSSGQTLKGIQSAGLHQYLGLDTSCSILLDSGGYLYLKRDDVRGDPYTVLRLYEDLTPTICAVLDYPLDPLEVAEVNEWRWQQTLVNTRFMFENNGQIALMPIIHAHSAEEAHRACNDLRQIIKEPTILGIGSLVPLMRTHHDGRVVGKPSSLAFNQYHQSSRHLAVDIIKTVRAEFPNTFLHVFGVGGTTTMHLIFALGVDSIDSIGWRLKAGYGAIQLPGIGDRFTGDKKREKRTLLKDDGKAKEALLDCQCPVCREHATLENRLAALDKSFNNRALHNAWVFVQEAAAFRTQVEADMVEVFVRQRLQHSPLKSLLPGVFG
ncbi:MAG: hypothetical protein AB1523_08000 [Bacillota bacterium]